MWYSDGYDAGRSSDGVSCKLVRKFIEIKVVQSSMDSKY